VAPRDELDLTTYRRLARELDELGTFLVSVEGGEPLLRPDLPAIVEALAERHIPALFTNGWHVTDELAAELWDRGLVHASVSIDYPEAARHDAKRDLDGAFARAVRALEHFARRAPNGGRQVNVMSVVMADNAGDLDALCRLSQRLGVGHQLTLLSVSGYRRKDGQDHLPPAGTGEALAKLHERYPHVRFFRSYFDRIDAFLGGSGLPTCHAGVQSFNIDHVGNVSPCIERIDRVMGNVRHETLATIHARLVAAEAESMACQKCWTACRGVTEALGGGSDLRSLATMASRMRP
jgi:MoaA/NifB/PqqE/SkfB family radical SAM enzyme